MSVRHFQNINSNSSSEQWKSINVQLNRKPKNLPLTHDALDNLNDQFSSVFGASDIHFHKDARPDSSHTRPSVTEFQVYILMKSYKSNSPGPDGIPGYFYRSFADILAGPLAHVYNRCLNANLFPLAWKLADILPIPKGKTDYRPISLLPFPSKVFEKIIRDFILLPQLR